MNAMDILRPWERTVKGRLLPGLHGHQAKALAAVSVGMARSGHCDSGRVSAAMPGAAPAASARRRVERAVADGRIRPDRARADLARAVLGSLAACPGRRLVLILDETPCGGRLKCLKVVKSKIVCKWSGPSRTFDQAAANRSRTFLPLA